MANSSSSSSSSSSKPCGASNRNLAGRGSLQVLSAEIERLEAWLQDLEPRLRNAADAADAVRRPVEQLLESLKLLRTDRVEATERLSFLTKGQLAEIKRLTGSPPEAVRRTLAAVWLLLNGKRLVGKSVPAVEEAKHWPRCQRMLADEGFVERVQAVEPESLAEMPHIVSHIAACYFQWEPQALAAIGTASAPPVLESLLRPTPCDQEIGPIGPALLRASRTRRSLQNSASEGALRGLAVRDDLRLQRHRMSDPEIRLNHRTLRSSVSMSQLPPVKPALCQENVSRASEPCGVLYTWLQGLVLEYSRGRHLKAALEELEPKLRAAEEALAALEREAAEVEAALSSKRAELAKEQVAPPPVASQPQKVEEAPKPKPTPPPPPPPPPKFEKLSPEEDQASLQVVIDTPGMLGVVLQQLGRLVVPFSRDSSEIDKEQVAVLREIASAVQEEHRGRLKLLVLGHSEKDEAEGLDGDRAASVCRWLVENVGLMPGLFRSQGLTGPNSTIGIQPGHLNMPCVLVRPLRDLAVMCGPISMELAATSAPAGLYFEPKQKNIASEGRVILAAMARFINAELESGESVLIEGHTDKTEASEVGLARANAVRNALLQLGVRRKLRAESCGALYPTSKQHAAQQRRVLLRIV